MPMRCMARMRSRQRITRSRIFSAQPSFARADIADVNSESAIADPDRVVPAPVNLLEFDRAGLVAFFAGIGDARYRAEQVMEWIYHRHVTEFAEITDLGN